MSAIPNELSFKELAGKQRNYCFDYLKGLACVGIIFIHCCFPKIFGELVMCFVRFCVPFFFMISGFYAFNNSSPKIRRKAFRILFLGVVGLSIYLSIYLSKQAPCLLKIGSLWNWKQITRFLLTNHMSVGGHLWFMFALFYCYLAYWGVTKLRIQKQVFYIIPFLFIACVYLVEGNMLLFGQSADIDVYQNFWFCGFLFFMLGNYLYQYDASRIGNKTLVGVFILASLASLVESRITTETISFNLYLGTYLQTISFFLWGKQNPNWGAGSFITKIGKDYSLYVYIIHILIIGVCRKTFSLLEIDGNLFIQYTTPLIVVVLSVLVSICLKRTLDIIISSIGSNFHKLPVL